MTCRKWLAMTGKIDADVTRFRQIVRGKIRDNLKKYVTHGEMIGRQGRDLVSIPLPQLDVPHFRYGNNGRGGVGQGEGSAGQPVGKGDADAGPGSAGDAPGGHVLEVEVSLEELAKMLAEQLQLPHIQPKGTRRLCRKIDAMTVYAARGRSRYAISDAPMFRPCVARSLQELMIWFGPVWFRSMMIDGFVPGRLRPNPKRMPW